MPSISDTFVSESADAILSTGTSCLASCGTFFLCMRLLFTCPIVLNWARVTEHDTKNKSIEMSMLFVFILQR